MLLGVILLGWQVSSSHKWRFSPSIFGGMIVESVTWAIVLLGVGRLIDLGFSYLEQGRTCRSWWSIRPSPSSRTCRP